MLLLKTFLILLVICLINSSNVTKETFQNYYSKIFGLATKDKKIEIEPKTKMTLILNGDIKGKTTLFKIKLHQIINSCTKFPYKELIESSLKNSIIENKLGNVNYYLQTFLMIYQILYYQYAPLEEIKKHFNTSDSSYIIEQSNYIKEYLNILIKQSEDIYYFNKANKGNKTIQKYLNEYSLTHENLERASLIYDGVILLIKKEKNETITKDVLLFIDNRKQTFIDLYFLIHKKFFYINYEDLFEEYKEKSSSENKSLKKPYEYCFFISPLTDMIDVKYNVGDVGAVYLIEIYNENKINEKNVLIKARYDIKKDSLNKYTISTVENIYFEKGKQIAYNNDFILVQIKLKIKKKIFEEGGKSNNHMKVCGLIGACQSLIKMTNDEYYYYYINLKEDKLNPLIITMGKLIYLEDKEITDHVIYADYFNRDTMISHENEIKGYLWYLNNVINEIVKYKKIFDEDNQINKDDILKDIWKLAYNKYKILLGNIDLLIESLQNILEDNFDKYLNKVN